MHPLILVCTGVQLTTNSIAWGYNNTCLCSSAGYMRNDNLKSCSGEYEEHILLNLSYIEPTAVNSYFTSQKLVFAKQFANSSQPLAHHYLQSWKMVVFLQGWYNLPERYMQGSSRQTQLPLGPVHKLYSSVPS